MYSETIKKAFKWDKLHRVERFVKSKNDYIFFLCH